MKSAIRAILVLAALWSGFAGAGNVTVIHDFDGTEDIMPTSNFLDEYTCRSGAPPASLPYVEMGPFTVSESGEYRVADIWLWEQAPALVKGSENTVLWIYDGPFDARNPTQNLHAFFEWGGWNSVLEDGFVTLSSTRTYRLVLQKACSDDPGIGGFIVRGPGEVNGIGYPNSSRFYGDFSQVSNSNVAEFPGWGTHFFADPYSYTAPRSGYYRFYDVSTEMGGGPTLTLVYSAPFNASNPGANLIAEPPGFWIVTWVYLEAGQEVHVVQVDLNDETSWYQTVLHPPGELQGINSDFVGTYFDQAKKGQGFLVDMDDKYEFLFTALFTYTNAPVAALESVPGSGKQAVGSSDQRWLTAYGPFSEHSTEVDLTFELTSGGRFNSMTPPAVRTDAYGTGKLIAHDCETIDIQYSLPDGDGVFNLSRILPGFTRDCAAQVPVAEPVR